MTQRSPSTQQPSRIKDEQHRRRDIQGLRAIAVLAVIAFHADLPIPGGFTGVDIFFVISGFVITQLILRRHSAGTFSYRDFYARRAQRLLPALALMVVVVFIASFLFQSPFGAQQQTALVGIGSMLLSANIVIIRTVGAYFLPVVETNPLLHTWSLSVEEQFYLLFPVALVLALTWLPRHWRRFSRANAALAPAVIVVAAVTGMSFAVSLLWSYGIEPLDLTNQPATWAFYQAPARAWEFGAGSLLALASARGKLTWLGGASTALAVVGVALVIGGFFLITPTSVFPGVWALLPVLGTAALIAAGSGAATNPVSRGLGAAAMVRIGDWSYSLYLWHWPVIVFFVLLWDSPWAALVGAVVSVAPALVSYYFVEEPIRRRRISRGTIVRAGLLTSLVVVVLGIALWTVGSRFIPAVQALEDERRTPTISEAAGCFLPTELNPEADLPRLSQECWFGGGPGGDWILLAGDSHASHASSGVIQAARQRGLAVFSITGGACPFLTDPVAYSDLDECDALNSYLWTMIESDDPPSAVVLSSKGVAPGAANTLKRLERDEIPIIWLQDVPRWSAADQGIQHLPCRGGALTFACTFPEAEVQANQALTRSAEEELQQSFPEVTFIDARDLFCSAGTCSPIQDGLLRYADNEHLNDAGSEELSDLFADAFEQALGPA